MNRLPMMLLARAAAGGGGEADLEFLGFDTDDTSFNFVGIDLGVPASDRRIVVGLSAQTTSGGAWSITVGGVAMSLVRYQDERNRCWIYDVAYPTGAAADIVGSGLSPGNLLVSVWAVYGDLEGSADGKADGNPSVSLPDCLTGDQIVAVSSGWSNGGQPVWSGGVAEVSQRTASSSRQSHASGIAAGDAPTVEANWPGSSNYSVTAAHYRKA